MYRGSRDGWMSKDFHSLCDNKGATITLIKTDDGWVCGGFTSLSWDTSGSWKCDQLSMLFSVDKQRVFSINED